MFCIPAKLAAQPKLKKTITFWSDDATLLRSSTINLTTYNSLMNTYISNYSFDGYDTINTHKVFKTYPKYIFYVELDTFTNCDSVIDKLNSFNIQHLFTNNVKTTILGCTPTSYNDPYSSACGDALPSFDPQWPLINIQASCAHSISDGAGEKVAIIDLDFEDHEDILANRASINFFPSDPAKWFKTNSDHGSAAASFGFAENNNNKGIASLGNKTKYAAYSLGLSDASAIIPDYKDYYEAVTHAISKGIKVISVSIKVGFIPSEELKEMIEKNNVTFVFAAGNSEYGIENGILIKKYKDWYAYYNKVDGAIVVGATDKADHFSPGYTHYPAIDVCAPGLGVRIISAPNLNCVRNSNGTSYSAPMVAALVALMRKVDPNLRPYEIECIIKNSTDAIVVESGFPGFPNEMGTGRINAYKAVKMVQDRLAISHSGTLLSNTTWTGDVLITDDIIVPGNIELTIDAAYVKVGVDKSIIIEMGGKLTIINSIIESNWCGNFPPQQWNGIIVKGGGSNQPQISSGSYISGRVIIKNGSVIKNAHYGVSLGTSGSNSGGVVQTSNSKFKNCRFSIFIHGYISPTEPQKNYSNINETEFEWDAMLYGYSDFNTHIWMGDVRGINITGCKFSNTVPKTVLGEYRTDGSTISRGRGIGAWNCSFNVLPSDDPLTASSSSCNIPDGNPCEFNGLEIGVHFVDAPYPNINTPAGQAKIVISECVFTNNIYSTHLSNDYRSIVYKSVFTWDGAFGNFARTTPDKPKVSFGITQLNSQGLKNTDNHFVFGSFIDPYYNLFGIWHNNIFRVGLNNPRHHPGTTVAKNRFISNSPTINSTGHLIENLWTPNIQCNFYNAHLSYGWYSSALPYQNSSLDYINNGGNSNNIRMDAANIWANCFNSSVTSLDVFKSISGTATNAFRTRLQWNEFNPPLYDPINSINCKVNFDISTISKLWQPEPNPGFREANNFCNPTLFIAQSEIYCPGLDGYASTKDDDPRDPLHQDPDLPEEPFTLHQLETDQAIRDSLFDMLNIPDYTLLFNQDINLKNQLIGLAELDTRVENQLAAQVLIHFYNVIIPQNVGVIAPEAQNGKRQFNTNPSVILVPNPNPGSFIIKYPEDEELQYILYNTVGNIVNGNSGFTNTEIKLPDFIASGIYFISLKLKNQPTVVKKVLVYK